MVHNEQIEEIFFTSHFCREKILTFQEVYLSQFFNASQQERKVSTGSNNFYMLAWLVEIELRFGYLKNLDVIGTWQTSSK